MISLEGLYFAPEWLVRLDDAHVKSEKKLGVEFLDG